MDETLQLVIEMNEWIWKHFKADLGDMDPEEIDWRPLPQANTINAILQHLRVEAEWYLESLDHGAQSLYQDMASVQQLTESIPLDFERNLKELEELYSRFIVTLRRKDTGCFAAPNCALPGFPGRRSTCGRSPELSPGCASSHALGANPYHS